MIWIYIVIANYGDLKNLLLKKLQKLRCILIILKIRLRVAVINLIHCGINIENI